MAIALIILLAVAAITVMSLVFAALEEISRRVGQAVTRRRDARR